jgi:acyl-CoA synthetase (AMP-forming)/AMP-acid ligase II
MTEQREGPYHIARYAAESPERVAYIMGTTGAVTTYGALDRRSRKLSRHLAANGLAPADRLAVMMNNNADYLAVCWAAQRLGLVYTPINWHLAAAEAGYIIENSQARALVVSQSTAPIAAEFADRLQSLVVKLTAGTPFGGFRNLEQVIDDTADGPDTGRYEGDVMYYSSGTTGRPKGIIRKHGALSWGEFSPLDTYLRSAYGLGPDTVYLVPAPLYHAAALSWCMNVLRAGGSVVLMEKFDPLETLRLIETYRVTHAQFVPTMFVRMLRLPEEQKSQYSLASLQMAIHAAAPCPAQIKRRMIQWFGPIIHEYYAGSEGNGVTAVDSATWCSHPGTVGKAAFGQIHILDDDGHELPANQDGLIYFSGGADFEYYKDEPKTASAFNAAGWSTLGDIGHLDNEGYLYLSDRRTDLIVSGGANIYPREVEDVLIQHPAVLDVAVIGIPNAEFGHEVKAIVELRPGVVGTAELAATLIVFCRQHIAGYKCPKSVDFQTLPRLENGKMLKRELRKRYL